MTEQKEKSNKVLFIILGCLGAIVLAVVLVIITGIVAAIAIPSFVKNSEKYQIKSEETIARSMLQSLQSAAAIYVAQQRVTPEKFSDFVTYQGPADGTSAHVYTLQNVRDAIVEPDSEEDLNGNSFEMEFVSGLKTKYYLNGTDITMELK